MRIARRGFLRAVVGNALFLFSLSRKGSAQAKPIVIGHQAPLTGAVAQFGKWHNKAVRAASELINSQGGIAGRKVELVTEDEASDPETGKDKFKKLVLQGAADFVIGTVWTATNLATAPLARELRTVYFPQGIATDIVGASGNRYVFKSYHTVRAAVSAGTRWAVDNLGKRWTIIASQLDFAQSQAQDWNERLRTLGAQVVDVITVPFRPSDFFPFLSRVNLGRSDVLYQAFTAVDTIRFLQAALELGFQTRVKMLGLIEGVDVLDTRSPAFEGTYYITGYPRRADQIPADRKQLDDSYRQRIGIGADGLAPDGNEVAPIADLFGAWQAVFLIKRGIERSGWRDKADNPGFIRALEDLQLKVDVGFPQGDQFLRAQDHLAFHDHYVERVESGQLKVLLRIDKDASLYPAPVDYTLEGF